MNAIIGQFSRLSNNPHTTVAGAIYALCAFARIWFPQYEHQLRATQGLAVFYGLGMAGDAKKDSQPPKPPTP